MSNEEGGARTMAKLSAVSQRRRGQAPDAGEGVCIGVEESVRPSFVWMTIACLARKTFSSSMREYPAAQELEPGASIHFAFDDLEPVDLTLDLPIAPGLGQRGAERVLITAQARCE